MPSEGSSSPTTAREATRTLSQQLVPLAMLFVAAVTYALTFSLNRIAITGGIPVIPYVFWQALGGAVILLIASLAARTPPKLDLLHLRAYFIIGFIGLALPYSLLALVAPRVPAGVLSLGLTLSPILTYVFAAALSMDSFRLVRTAGILFGLAGVLLVLLPRASLPSPEMVPWVLLGFSVPACFALLAISAARFRPPGAGSLPLACGLLFAASILLLPLMASLGTWWFFEGPMDRADWALIGVILINALFFVLAFEIIRLAGPVFFSTNNYIATLAGVGWAILIFGEEHSLWIWAALVLLFVGLFLVNRKSKQPRAALA